MTVGIVGAGQLGRMLALAGYPLGLDFLCLDPARDAPAGQVAPLLHGAFTDRTLLKRLARRCEVLTFDWENVPAQSLQAVTRTHGARICPPVAALTAAQDRVSEKRLFEKLGIPTTRWRAVSSWAQLQRSAKAIGLPGVIKTRRLGYDGKGQAVVRTAEDLARAWQQLGGAALIYEELVPFDCEVSIIGARSVSGEIAIYPLCGNVHAQGILRVTRAPYGPAQWQAKAATYLRRVLRHFHYT
jgi:5-(carboxyamino)imidazole ribonucleotide synthase